MHASSKKAQKFKTGSLKKKREFKNSLLKLRNHHLMHLLKFFLKEKLKNNTQNTHVKNNVLTFNAFNEGQHF